MQRSLETVLAGTPFLGDLEPDAVALLVGCAGNVRFLPGEYLFQAGDAADTFYVLRHGAVAIETFVPGRGAVTIETVEGGEVLGWSWLFAPYHWHFDARALTVVRATGFDGVCLRDKCDADSTLGYALMSRFARVLIERLEATRLRLVDMYGSAERL